MKTKKLFVYVLISLFVFSPFLNVESWGALPIGTHNESLPCPGTKNGSGNRVVCLDLRVG